MGKGVGKETRKYLWRTDYNHIFVYLIVFHAIKFANYDQFRAIEKLVQGRCGIQRAKKMKG